MCLTGDLCLGSICLTGGLCLGHIDKESRVPPHPALSGAGCQLELQAEGKGRRVST